VAENLRRQAAAQTIREAEFEPRQVVSVGTSAEPVGQTQQGRQYDRMVKHLPGLLGRTSSHVIGKAKLRFSLIAPSPALAGSRQASEAL
jgi:hypothetical protein